MVGLDASTLMHPRVWEASGHLEGFTDPLVDCKMSTTVSGRPITTEACSGVWRRIDSAPQFQLNVQDP